MENKTVFLLIDGENDYDAMLFQQEYETQNVYEEMIANGVTTDSRYVIEAEDHVRVRILEFEAVDRNFIEFVKNEIQDYDMSKFKDFIQVNPII